MQSFFGSSAEILQNFLFNKIDPIKIYNGSVNTILSGSESYVYKHFFILRFRNGLYLYFQIEFFWILFLLAIYSFYVVLVNLFFV